MRAPAAPERMAVRRDPAGEARPPATKDWDRLRRAAAHCEACPLYRRATQTVFGEGPRPARIVFLGEQPGDQEDREGRPFVGPAGRLLDRALTEAGVAREECYVTNAVKHFKWEPRGKRRLHQKPDRAEIAACRPWWKAELSLVQPEFLVCLGGTAARAVWNRVVKVSEWRGRFLETEWCPRTLVTVHPSAILRIPDSAGRHRELARLVADFRLLRE